MSWLARPLSWAYSGAMQIRNVLFDRGIMKSESFSVPIVSVGNISVGGTGKTPVIQALAHWAISNGLKPGIVSRGYGGSYSGVQEVQLDVEQAVFLYGDEPVLTKGLFPEVPFFVCHERVRAVSEMLKKNQLDIVFADDAFQHRALSRDLDIVLLDACQAETHYSLLPLGRLREPLEQLSRAHFIVVTRWNLADSVQKNFIKQLIETYTGQKLQSTIFCDYEITEVDGLASHEEVILFSGIGNPKAFEMMMSSKAKILSHKIFKDHYNYDLKDIENLLLENKVLVTTEKDAVKLKAIGASFDNIKVAKLGLKFDSNLEKLIGAIHQLSS